MAAFAPIFGVTPKILILGSMPSQISIKENQYYGNPRNAFWWIMSELFNFDLTLNYRSRCIALGRSGIAVWDVLYDCERPGSLDSAIVKGSEQPNDFRAFFRAHPSLLKVVFNGKASATLFARQQKNFIQDITQTQPNFEWCRCPSTSPAHASITRHDKLEAWRQAVT